MAKFGGRKGARACAIVCGLLAAVCSVVAVCAGVFAAGGAAPTTASQHERVDIRLRSFVPRASGQLTIEPSAEGGRARLTAMRLPDPRTQSRDATTYVVWANSEGRIVRLGELARDARGNGGLAFNHPGYERYTVLVTAEPTATAERPLGAPVLSTRANEAIAVFPVPATSTGGGRPVHISPVRSARRSGGFYDEVDDALAASDGGRLIELEGGEVAPAARGSARAAEASGRAYVVVRFRDLPMPNAAGAGAYVLWAIQPNQRIVYMGSLPADPTLNAADIYVRVPGFSSDDFDLFVTAEQKRPAFTPSDRRALSTRNARNTVR